jgi:hypothetical protein
MIVQRKFGYHSLNGWFGPSTDIDRAIPRSRHASMNSGTESFLSA